MTSRLEVTGSGDDDPITTSLCDAIYRGVETDASPVTDEDSSSLRSLPPPEYTETTTIPISRTFPHLYSECASIWNPIHTERRVALAAGLPDIIVHGTALWALVWKHLSQEHGDLSRLAGRFSAMVVPGEAVTLRTSRLDGETRSIAFRLDNLQGDPAINAGHAAFR